MYVHYVLTKLDSKLLNIISINNSASISTDQQIQASCTKQIKSNIKLISCYYYVLYVEKIEILQ